MYTYNTVYRKHYCSIFTRLTLLSLCTVSLTTSPTIDDQLSLSSRIGRFKLPFQSSENFLHIIPSVIFIHPLFSRPPFCVHTAFDSPSQTPPITCTGANHTISPLAPPLALHFFLLLILRSPWYPLYKPLRHRFTLRIFLFSTPHLPPHQLI